MLLALFTVLLFAYSLVSGRLQNTPFTAPIVFTLAGILAFPAEGSRLAQANIHGFLTLAEIGLVLLLFTDASRTDLKLLNHIRQLPVRLLGLGMPATILLGAAAAKLVFPQFSWWEAGILAAILAPTDAGLGQVIVNSTSVPGRVREALNVEAGLNDGLSVPFLLFFIAMAGGGEAGFARFLGEQLGLGLAVGLGIGLAGGWLLETARLRKWMADSYLQIAVVALPVFCLILCKPLSASPFIAAFAAGLATQICFKHAGRHSVEFTEEWGQILNLSVFFLFGLLIGRVEGLFAAEPFIYAILSLTLVRLVPVTMALRGSGLDRKTIAFMGWFGPRGLASIVLGLVYLSEAGALPGEHSTRLAVMATVLASIFAHGLSARAGIRMLASGQSS